jgi:hypothetical protein
MYANRLSSFFSLPAKGGLRPVIGPIGRLNPERQRASGGKTGLAREIRAPLSSLTTVCIYAYICQFALLDVVFDLGGDFSPGACLDPIGRLRGFQGLQGAFLPALRSLSPVSTRSAGSGASRASRGPSCRRFAVFPLPQPDRPAPGLPGPPGGLLPALRDVCPASTRAAGSGATRASRGPSCRRFAVFQLSLRERPSPGLPGPPGGLPAGASQSFPCLTPIGRLRGFQGLQGAFCRRFDLSVSAGPGLRLPASGGREEKAASGGKMSRAKGSAVGCVSAGPGPRLPAPF